MSRPRFVPARWPFVTLVTLVATAGVLTSVGCVSRGDQRLVVTGSSTVAPLAAEIARRFEAAHPGVRIDVQSGGSSRGIADARRGIADVGMVSRSLTATESDLRAHVIARDGVALVVHADNPVRSLSREQIVGLYTGQLDEWSDVGGTGDAVTVVNKADGRATLAVFLDHFRLESRDIEADVVVGENQHAIKTVAGDPSAIGYVSIGAAEHAVRSGLPVALVTLDALDPSSAAVAAGRWPIARPLNLVTTGEPSPLARRFIDFARSETARELVRAQSFVPPST